jgi:membrane protein
MLERASRGVRRFRKLLVETVHAWQRDHASLMAAALAFYTMVAVVSLLIIALSIASRWYGPDEILRRVEQGGGVLIGPAATETLLQSPLGSVPESGLAATLVSIVIVIYGSTRVFGELHRSLSVIWRRPDLPPEGFHPLRWLRRHLFAFLMVLATGALWLIGIVSSTAITALGAWARDRIDLPRGLGFASIMQPIASVVLLTAALSLLYRFLSQGRACWSESLLGAALTAVLMTAGQKVLALYLRHPALESVYGATGAILVIAFYFYYSWMIFLLGAEMTKVATALRARRRG